MGDKIEITANQKGALGEVLLTTNRTLIRDYFSEWCLDDLQSHNPEWIPEEDFNVKFSINSSPPSHDVSIDGEHAAWYPDALYTLHFQSESRLPESFDRYRVKFPVEVKTGQSSELSANQRAVMATIEQRTSPIFPIRVRVDVSGLPDSFTVTPWRIQKYEDDPLPNYSGNGSPHPPKETREETINTNQLTTSRGNNPLRGLPEDMVKAIEQASNDYEDVFSEEEVLNNFHEVSESELANHLRKLGKRGVAYECGEGEWKFIIQRA